MRRHVFPRRCALSILLRAVVSRQIALLQKQVWGFLLCQLLIKACGSISRPGASLLEGPPATSKGNGDFVAALLRVQARRHPT